jgi:hypothetical protein
MAGKGSSVPKHQLPSLSVATAERELKALVFPRAASPLFPVWDRVSPYCFGERRDAYPVLMLAFLLLLLSYSHYSISASPLKPAA